MKYDYTQHAAIHSSEANMHTAVVVHALGLRVKRTSTPHAPDMIYPRTGNRRAPYLGPHDLPHVGRVRQHNVDVTEQRELVDAAILPRPPSHHVPGGAAGKLERLP